MCVCEREKERVCVSVCACVQASVRERGEVERHEQTSMGLLKKKENLNSVGRFQIKNDWCC